MAYRFLFLTENDVLNFYKNSNFEYPENIEELGYREYISEEENIRKACDDFFNNNLDLFDVDEEVKNTIDGNFINIISHPKWDF